MTSERRRRGAPPPSETTGAEAERPEPPRFSRRQAIGGISAMTTAGVAAWVVPEILTAKPAAGATLSGVTAPATLADTSPATASSTTGTSEPLAKVAGALATTGLDLQRDAEIGVALIAGGWAMHHWASRPLSAGTHGAPGSPGSAAGSESPTPAQ